MPDADLSLDFDLLDDLALGVERARIQFQKLGRVSANSLGPLIEMAFVASNWEQSELSEYNWLHINGFSDIIRELGTQESDEQRTGVKTGWICGDQLTDETPWTGFLIRVSSVCKSGGFDPRAKNAIMAAFGEFRSNVLEHAGQLRGAIAAFHLGDRGLEIVVADKGRGVLASMQSSDVYKSLDDSGSALKLIVTDGVSRYDSPERGHGFTYLFQGLANRFNHIRLRSGDHALEVFRENGVRPTERVSQKARIPGLLVYARFDRVS